MDIQEFQQDLRSQMKTLEAENCDLFILKSTLGLNSTKNFNKLLDVLE